MFDRTRSQPGAGRPLDEPFGKMLFGGARRNGFRPPVVPAMERVSPQTTVERPTPTNDAEVARGGFPCPEACSLAMVYSPVQQWQGLYPVGEALRKGTLFADLDKPFSGKTLLGR